jgi:alkanesulfonate monooxygenase SsuD/methylene tetrahydromethanopterin reductase-like flavin-dependent oxidoreductase (luciferase family)
MWDLRRPADFDAASDKGSDEALEKVLTISEDTGRHAADIAALAALGATVHLHCVGRNQEAFLDTFGAKVLPRLD